MHQQVIPQTSLVSGKLLVGVAIPEASTEVVPTSFPQEPKTNTPFEQDTRRSQCESELAIPYGSVSVFAKM